MNCEYNDSLVNIHMNKHTNMSNKLKNNFNEKLLKIKLKKKEKDFTDFLSKKFISGYDIIENSQKNNILIDINFPYFKNAGKIFKYWYEHYVNKLQLINSDYDLELIIYNDDEYDLNFYLKINKN